MHRIPISVQVRQLNTVIRRWDAFGSMPETYEEVRDMRELVFNGVLVCGFVLTMAAFVVGCGGAL